MLMFTFHMAQALALIALGLGLALIIWGGRHEGKGVVAAKFFGYIIAILAIINIGCNSYTGYKYWKEGIFDARMHVKTMMDKQQVQPNNMMRGHL